MTVTGRNEACPCGSGKKFKKCHGAMAISISGVRPDIARANALKAVDVELGKKLLRFAMSRFGREWMSSAIGFYLDGEGDKLPEAEVPLAIPWLMHSLAADDDGNTVAEVWRHENAKRVSSDESMLLDAYAASWLSVWEAANVEPGVGVTLVDLLTREERFVHDVSSSQSVHRLDGVLAFVLDCDGVSFFCGVHGHLLPPRGAEPVVRDARKLCRVRTRPVAVAKLRDIDIQLDIIAAWNYEVDKMLRRPPPTLTNTDGDALVLTTDDFELLAPRSAVVDGVASIDGAEREDAGDEILFVVTKPGNPQLSMAPNTVLANILIGKKSLRVETNSARRADAARALLESHLGTMVRFRLRSEANTAAMMQQAMTKAAAENRAPAEPQPAEMVAFMREFREQHMTAWLDESIPALDGLTPRASARVKHMRPALDLLLKEFEHHEARLPAEERIDIGRLRRELML
jgi:hypothetical protein